MTSAVAAWFVSAADGYVSAGEKQPLPQEVWSTTMVETFVQSTDDVVNFLTDQHNLIKDMFDDVLSASSDEARERAFVDLRQLLAVHETAEEMVVHPRARKELSNGDEVVDARL